MRTLLLFLVTCIVGTGALLAANTMPHPLPAYLAGFGVWGLFIYYAARRRR